MPRLAVTIDDHEFEIELDLLKRDGSALLARVNGEPVRIILPEADEPAGVAWMVIDDHPYEIALDGDLRWIRDENGAHAITVRDMDVLGRPPNLKDGRVKAPIPGQIVRILVSVGQHVKAGEPLLILEAMKMENEIRSPRSGIVAAIHVNPQGNVARKDLLLEIQ